jgi:hypothetical protein
VAASMLPFKMASESAFKSMVMVLSLLAVCGVG